jgi:hypothetical protein
MEMAAKAASAPAVCSGPGLCRAARWQHPAARVLIRIWWSSSDDGHDSPYEDILNHSFGLLQRRPAQSRGTASATCATCSIAVAAIAGCTGRHLSCMAL